jgi:uncharacterized protein YutE (UPF0331/DUF86 family)
VYDVNVKRIASQLRVLAECARVLEKIDLEQANLTERFAAERAMHVAVECMIDVGSVMIDGFVMRDPGGYLDIVDILEDEKVITPDVAERLRRQVRFRERLVRYYDEIDGEEFRKFDKDVALYRTFDESVRKYIKQELGEDCLA